MSAAHAHYSHIVGANMVADVILSLTRTKRVGYLRDVRRMTVALSRARLGLYILGRKDVFEWCHELAPAFNMLLQRPHQLMLVTGEMWPSTRGLGDGPGDLGSDAAMDGVEHLGHYVFDMTNTRIEHLRKEGSNAMAAAGPNDGLETIDEHDEAGAPDPEGQDEDSETLSAENV